MALQGGILDRVALDDIASFRSELSPWLHKEAKEAVEAVERTGKLDAQQNAALTAALTGLAARFARSDRAQAAGAE